MTTSASPMTANRRAALAGAGAVLATALLWAAAQILGLEMHVDPGTGQPPQAIGLPLAAAVTLAVSLLGCAQSMPAARAPQR